MWIELIEISYQTPYREYVSAHSFLCQRPISMLGLKFFLTFLTFKKKNQKITEVLVNNYA